MNIIKILLIGFVAFVLLLVGAVGIFAVTFDANEYKQNLSELVKQKTNRQLDFKGDIELSLYPVLGMKLGSMTFSNAPGFGDKPMLAVNHASVSVDVLSILSFNPQVAELIMDGLSVNLQTNKRGKTNWDDLVTESKPKSVSRDDDKDTTVRIKTDVESELEVAFGGIVMTNVNLLWSDAQADVEYQVNIASLLTGKITQEEPFPLQISMTLNSLNELSASIELKSDVLLGKQKVTLTSLVIESSAAGALIPFDRVLLKLNSNVEFSTLTRQLGLSGFSTSITTSGGALQSSQTRLAGEIGFDLNKQHLTIGVLDVQSELTGSTVPNGKMKASLSASQLEMRLNKRSIHLNDLVLALNENKFEGFVKVLDYDRPNINFSVKAERFDIDRLLGKTVEPEPVPEATESTETVVAAEDVQIQLPMELLRDLKLKGELEIGTLVTQGLTVNNVILKMGADKGLLNLAPIAMDLYDGNYVGSVKINVQGKQPVYSVKKKLSSFQVGQFLQDFSGEDPVSGNANFTMDMTTRGEWLSKLKSNLNGDLSMFVKDGALNGFNLRHEVESAKAKLRRKEEPVLGKRQTDFSALSLSGVIKEGVFSSEDLDVQAPLLRVGGKGSVDLVQETVDYLVNAKVVTTSKGQQGGSADELSGVSIPVAITGSWLMPEIDVQLDEMLKAKLAAKKEQIRRSLANQKAALKHKLDAEKASLKASQEKKLAAQKLQLEKKRQLEEASKKEKLEKKKQAETEKAKKKLEQRLKKLF
ncbi:MAG: AsmA family protein [Gammaproteobacteria bacterium]|nr:AsmA family protein [Gammaproteobacteria bacterium]